MLVPAGAHYAYVELLVWMASGWVTFDDVSFSRQLSEKKYYYAGATRVAMRVDDEAPLYILGDHPSACDLWSPLRTGLGSTSVVAKGNGTLVSRMLYKPLGETRDE